MPDRSLVMKSLLSSLLFFSKIVPSAYINPADTLPPPPGLPKALVSGYVNLSAVDIWYAQFGKPLAQTKEEGLAPVVFLHGAFASSDYFGNQVRALIKHEPCLSIMTIDSRLQGRSTGAATAPISYDLMREDVIGVLDHFGIPKATIVGWSDGGIIGLNMALNTPSRLERYFGYGTSFEVENVSEKGSNAPVWLEYVNRTKSEYRAQSPTANQIGASRHKINHMLDTLPNYTKAQLRSIPTLYQNCTSSPLMWFVDGSDEEILKRGTARQLHNAVNGSSLALLPSVSHFG